MSPLRDLNVIDLSVARAAFARYHHLPAVARQLGDQRVLGERGGPFDVSA